MEPSRNSRRLTTVLAADVVAYSEKTARNEDHAVGLVGRRLDMAGSFIKQHEGRVFSTAGDALLAEFASPVEAVRCAIEIQEAMRTANELAAVEDRLQFRIGINIGDVIVKGNDLLGDGVNVASRLEGLALAGGICVSSSVYELLVGKLTLGAEDLGDQHVKNISRPIRAYRLTAQGAPPFQRHKQRLWRRLMLPASAALLLAATSVFVIRWYETSTSSAQTTLAAAGTPGPTAAPAVSPSPATQSRLPLVPESIPFIDDRARERLREAYLRSVPAKAVAISALGHYGWSTQRVDEAAARKQALDICTTSLKRVTPDPPPYAGCSVYAVDDHVVWTFRPPAMPVPPWIPTNRPSPQVRIDPTKAPIASANSRASTNSAYMQAPGSKAIAIGRGLTINHVWNRVSDFAAMRAALEACGFQSQRPCFVYAIGDEVVVRQPETARIIDVIVPEDLAQLSDGDRRRIATTFVPDADWRALAIGKNGRIGLGLRQGDEQRAVDLAMRACEEAGGLDCTLIAIGPFKVSRN